MMTKYSDIVVESSSDDESVRLHNISGRDRRFHIDSSDDDDDDLSEIKSKRGCITCSYRSIEKKQVGKKKTKYFQQGRYGLQCHLCKRFMCNVCVRKVYPEIAKEKKSFHSDCSQYLNGMKLFYDSNGLSHPCDFTNHCCLIRQHCCRKENHNRTDELSTKSHDKTLMGGALCLPEFKLIIPTDFGSIDILGLGEEAGLPARYHYVIDEVNALLHESNNVRPMSDQPTNWIYRRHHQLKVDLPHGKQYNEVKRRTRKFKCDLYYVPLTMPMKTPAARKGCNEITPEDVVKFYLFQPKTDCDISFIIGYNEGTDRGSILLLRFHRLCKDLVRKVSGNASIQMWKKMFSQLKNDGIERFRKGGSSGYASYDLLLNKLMSTPNSSPRNSPGVIWLLDKHLLLFHAFYVNTSECEVKHVTYSTPRIGGSFQMQSTLIKESDLLQQFIMTKPLAAVIIKEIERKRYGKRICNEVRVCPHAVNNELENASKAREYVNGLYNDMSKHCTERKRDFYQFYSKKFVKFTLVSHPVGQHLDAFPNKNPSLEIRLCFTHAVDSSGSYGRGGNGLHNFTWALLDWQLPKEKKKKTTVKNTQPIPVQSYDSDECVYHNVHQVLERKLEGNVITYLLCYDDEYITLSWEKEANVMPEIIEIVDDILGVGQFGVLGGPNRHRLQLHAQAMGLTTNDVSTEGEETDG